MPLSWAGTSFWNGPPGKRSHREGNPRTVFAEFRRHLFQIFSFRTAVAAIAALRAKRNWWRSTSSSNSWTGLSETHAWTRSCTRTPTRTGPRTWFGSLNRTSRVPSGVYWASTGSSSIWWAPTIRSCHRPRWSSTTTWISRCRIISSTRRTTRTWPVTERRRCRSNCSS